MEQCAQKYYRRYILKEADKQTYAAARGEDIHAKAEHFLKGGIVGLPAPLAHFKEEFKALAKAKPAVETWLAVDKNWKPADQSTSWIVGKTDVHLVQDDELTIIDFKSGKIYPDKHAMQGSLYAALGAALFDVRKVHLEWWYLDKNDMLTWDYTEEQLRHEKEEWTTRGKALQATQEFPCKPSFLCKWCPYSAAHSGGTCKAG
jgi:RecB family exonuclease